MKKEKAKKVLATAMVWAVLFSGCASAGENKEDTETLQAAPSAVTEEPAAGAEDTAKEPQATEPAADTQEEGAASQQAVPEEGADTKETAYGEGNYAVYAQKEGSSNTLRFENGKLLFHFFSDASYGKGGYGEGCSDKLEYSPYYQMTLEEAAALLEQEGFEVNIEKE